MSTQPGESQTLTVPNVNSTGSGGPHRDRRNPGIRYSALTTLSCVMPPCYPTATALQRSWATDMAHLRCSGVFSDS